MVRGSPYHSIIMEIDFYPRWYKSRIMKNMKKTQFYITGDICVINSTSLDGRCMAQKRTSGYWKKRYNMCKISCNITSGTTWEE